MKIIPPTINFDEITGFDKEIDIFNRKKIGESLSGIVFTPNNKIVISLNGDWGEGKSTFLQMWIKEVQKTRQNTKIIYYDAFINDHVSDIFEAITTQIYQVITKPEQKDKIIKHAKNIGKTLAKEGLKIATKALASKLLYQNADKDLLEIADKLTDATYDSLQTTPATDIQNQYKNFKKALSEAATSTENDSPIIFIVDELDRCRPDHALEFIETIKHAFSTDGIVFILSMNRTSLNAMIENRYGKTVNGDFYLQKFIDLWMTLPKYTKNKNTKVSQKYFSTLYQQICQDKNIKVRRAAEYLEDLIESHEPTLRQVEKMLTHLAIINNTLPNDIDDSSYQLALASACFLKTCKTDIYESLCQKQCGKTSFIQALVHCGQNEITSSNLLKDILFLAEFDWRTTKYTSNQEIRGRQISGMLQLWMQTHENERITEHACTLANFNLFDL